jgi:hypothetical protein
MVRVMTPKAPCCFLSTHSDLCQVDYSAVTKVGRRKTNTCVMSQDFTL